MATGMDLTTMGLSQRLSRRGNGKVFRRTLRIHVKWAGFQRLVRKAMREEVVVGGWIRRNTKKRRVMAMANFKNGDWLETGAGSCGC
jgi:hypothetical protein